MEPPKQLINYSSAQGEFLIDTDYLEAELDRTAENHRRLEEIFEDCFNQKRDFRERGTIIFRESCYRNHLLQSDEKDEAVLSDPKLLGDKKLQGVLNRIIDNTQKWSQTGSSWNKRKQARTTTQGPSTQHVRKSYFNSTAGSSKKQDLPKVVHVNKNLAKGNQSSASQLQKLDASAVANSTLNTWKVSAQKQRPLGTAALPGDDRSRTPVIHPVSQQSTRPGGAGTEQTEMKLTEKLAASTAHPMSYMKSNFPSLKDKHAYQLQVFRNKKIQDQEHRLTQQFQKLAQKSRESTIAPPSAGFSGMPDEFTSTQSQHYQKRGGEYFDETLATHSIASRGSNKKRMSTAAAYKPPTTGPGPQILLSSNEETLQKSLERQQRMEDKMSEQLNKFSFLYQRKKNHYYRNQTKQQRSRSQQHNSLARRNYREQAQIVRSIVSPFIDNHSYGRDEGFENRPIPRIKDKLTSSQFGKVSGSLTNTIRTTADLSKTFSRIPHQQRNPQHSDFSQNETFYSHMQQIDEYTKPMASARPFQNHRPSVQISQRTNLFPLKTRSELRGIGEKKSHAPTLKALNSKRPSQTGDLSDMSLIDIRPTVQDFFKSNQPEDSSKFETSALKLSQLLNRSSIQASALPSPRIRDPSIKIQAAMTQSTQMKGNHFLESGEVLPTDQSTLQGPGSIAITGYQNSETSNQKPPSTSLPQRSQVSKTTSPFQPFIKKLAPHQKHLQLTSQADRSRLGELSQISQRETFDRTGGPGILTKQSHDVPATKTPKVDQRILPRDSTDAPATDEFISVQNQNVDTLTELRGHEIFLNTTQQSVLLQDDQKTAYSQQEHMTTYGLVFGTNKPPYNRNTKQAKKLETIMTKNDDEADDEVSKRKQISNHAGGIPLSKGKRSRQTNEDQVVKLNSDLVRKDSKNLEVASADPKSVMEKSRTVVKGDLKIPVQQSKFQQQQEQANYMDISEFDQVSEDVGFDEEASIHLSDILKSSSDSCAELEPDSKSPEKQPLQHQATSARSKMSARGSQLGTGPTFITNIQQSTNIGEVKQYLKEKAAVIDEFDGWNDYKQDLKQQSDQNKQTLVSINLQSYLHRQAHKNQHAQKLKHNQYCNMKPSKPHYRSTTSLRSKDFRTASVEKSALRTVEADTATKSKLDSKLDLWKNDKSTSESSMRGTGQQSASRDSEGKRVPSKSNPESPSKKAAAQPERPPINFRNLHKTQARFKKLMTHLFHFWAKKRTSKYLRITDFYKNMVLFGLAPSSLFLQRIVKHFEERIQKPSFTFPRVPEGRRVPDLADLKKLKPFNKYFVYSVDIEAKLTVTHISLEAILELYQVTKHSMNLQEFLLEEMHEKFIKNMQARLAKMKMNVPQSQLQKLNKDIMFNVQQFEEEVESQWELLDPLHAKEISKPRLYRFLNENRLVQNCDDKKADEFFRTLLITFGAFHEVENMQAYQAAHTIHEKPAQGSVNDHQSSAANLNLDIDEVVISSKDTQSRGVAAGGVSNLTFEHHPGHGGQLPNKGAQQYELKFLDGSVEDLQTISKSLVVKLFEKVVVQLALRNAICLLEASSQDLQGDTMFMEKYADDEISGILEVLKLKREFLYKSFKQENLKHSLKRQSLNPSKDKRKTIDGQIATSLGDGMKMALARKQSILLVDGRAIDHQKKMLENMAASQNPYLTPHTIAGEIKEIEQIRKNLSHFLK